MPRLPGNARPRSQVKPEAPKPPPFDPIEHAAWKAEHKRWREAVERVKRTPRKSYL